MQMVMRMKTALLLGAAVIAGAGAVPGMAQASGVSFSTFVSATDLTNLLGNTSTIAFNYAGNKFVGSVYLGTNNNQLYQTDLNGQNLQTFGTPVPGASGEVVVGASLGHGGFASGDIYAGNDGSSQIWHYGNAGGAPSLFGTTDDGSVVRQIFFDPGNSFGGDMFATTRSGHIDRFTSAGTRSLFAIVGADIEGIDIASNSFGPYSGHMIISSEGAAGVYAVSPNGANINLIMNIYSPETISTVPTNICNNASPLQGFYVANFASDIQKAAANQFCAYAGDIIVTQELVSNSPVSAIHWDGSNYQFTTIGFLPGQSEDGIFVTAERESAFVPEPASLALLGVGIAGIGLARRRRR